MHDGRYNPADQRSGTSAIRAAVNLTQYAGTMMEIVALLLCDPRVNPAAPDQADLLPQACCTANWPVIAQLPAYPGVDPSVNDNALVLQRWNIRIRGWPYA